MSQIPARVIIIVVLAIAVLAFMGVGTLCLSLFRHTYADPSILTALISLTSGLIGSLVTLLSSPRTHPPGESTTTTTTVSPPAVDAGKPQDVTIVNTPEAPAIVQEIKPEGT